MALLTPLFLIWSNCHPGVLVGLALLLTFIPSVLGTIWYGPVYSSAQGMVPQNIATPAGSLLSPLRQPAIRSRGSRILASGPC